MMIQTKRMGKALKGKLCGGLPQIKEAAGMKLQWDMKWRVKSLKMYLSAH